MPQTMNTSGFYDVKINGTVSMQVTSAGVDLKAKALTGVASAVVDAGGGGSTTPDVLTVIGPDGEVTNGVTDASTVLRVENSGDAAVTVLAGSNSDAALYLGRGGFNGDKAAGLVLATGTDDLTIRADASDIMTVNSNGIAVTGGGDFSSFLRFNPGDTVATQANGDIVFELTNNTTVTVTAKGSDGTDRSGTITLS